MKLPELLTVYRRRREDAERHGSTAPVARIYEVVLNELEELEVTVPQQKLRTSEVAAIDGVSPVTVARRCARGDYPGAEKTSGEKGEWRIPAKLVLAGKTNGEDRGPRRRILDD